MPGCKWWVIGVVTLLLSVGDCIRSAAAHPNQRCSFTKGGWHAVRRRGIHSMANVRRIEFFTCACHRTLTIRVRYGVMRVQLTPTSNASPGAYYRVTFNSNGRTQVHGILERSAEHYAVCACATYECRARSAEVQRPLVDSSVLITDGLGLARRIGRQGRVKAVGLHYGPCRVHQQRWGDGCRSLGNLSDCVHVGWGPSGGCGSGGGGDRRVPFSSIRRLRGPPGGVGWFQTRLSPLAGAPNPAISPAIISQWGSLQRAGVDYSLASNNVTFLAGAVPQTGDVIQAYYRK